MGDAGWEAVGSWLAGVTQLASLNGYALAKLLAAASVAGMDLQAVRAELGAQVSKLVSQQWAIVTSKRARTAAKSTSSK